MRIKHGFTLVESLICLSVVGTLFILCIPSIRHLSSSKYEVKTLKTLLEIAHRKAVEHQLEVEVSTYSNLLMIDDQKYVLNACELDAYEFKFLKTGNASKSLSIGVRCKNNKYTVVVHLGSGHVTIY